MSTLIIGAAATVPNYVGDVSPKGRVGRQNYTACYSMIAYSVGAACLLSIGMPESSELFRAGTRFLDARKISNHDGWAG